MDKIKPPITRMIQGVEEEVHIDEVWDSICKILRISRLLTCPGGEEYQVTRLGFLAERMNDLENLSFNYKRNPRDINLQERFVPSSIK